MPTEFPLAGGCGRLRGPAICSRRRLPAPPRPCRTRWSRPTRPTRNSTPNAPGSAARTRTCRRRLSGYRPQLVASLSSGLQAVRNILPDNTVQSANLKPWTIGLTVTQVLFNGYKTANNVRVAEFQVKSGREALRNIEQGVFLDAVTAYMNVMANYALVRGAAHQRPGAAGNPGDDETAARRRGRHADRYGAGRIASSAGDLPISTPPRSRLRSARRSTPRSSARLPTQLVGGKRRSTG